MQYKSQVGQDEWVCKMTNFKREGFFLDIGAHNGVYLSNTFCLEKDLGWNGICVESDLDTFNELLINRNCKCINIAIYSTDGPVQFTPPGNIRGIKSTLQFPMLGEGGGYLEAITMSKLMNDNNVPEYIDYISLDTEGADYEVLKGFPFDKYKVGFWSIEHNAYQDGGELQKKIRRLMADKGYKVALANNNFDDWFYE